jgi:hypothetical protein
MQSLPDSAILIFDAVCCSYVSCRAGIKFGFIYAPSITEDDLLHSSCSLVTSWENTPTSTPYLTAAYLRSWTRKISFHQAREQEPSHLSNARTDRQLVPLLMTSFSYNCCSPNLLEARTAIAARSNGGFANHVTGQESRIIDGRTISDQTLSKSRNEIATAIEICLSRVAVADTTTLILMSESKTARDSESVA